MRPAFGSFSAASMSASHVLGGSPSTSDLRYQSSCVLEFAGTA